MTQRPGGGRHGYTSGGLRWQKFFIIDISSLSTKQKNEILLLQTEMKVLNHTAFVSAKKACKRIIDAGGYGNGYVLDYFKQRYAELSDGTPYP